MKKKLLFLLTLLLSGTRIFSQVGINNNTPKATLDITAKTTDGSKPEGIIAPRLTGDQIKSANYQYGTDQKGTLIYATAAIGSTDGTGKTTNITAAGYYYFDGAAWQKVGAGDTTNDAWINDAGNAIIKLGTKSDGSTARDPGTDFVSKDDGTVGIGTDTPNKYARLDVNSTNQGILIPRVDLIFNKMDLNSDGDNNIINQPTGLIVFNHGTALPNGYYFWNGTEWRSIDSSTAISPSITFLNCSSASLSPSAWTAGTAYTGNLKVSYIGGNGGSYQSGSPITINNLTFTLRAGKLEFGSGELVFSVTGTPTSNSDMIIPFTSTTIPFLTTAQSCSATVYNQMNADIKSIAAMGFATYDTTSNSYVFPLSTPDKNYRIRVRISSTSSSIAGAPNVQLFNNAGSSKTLYWNYETIYGGLVANAGNNMVVPNGVWGGDNDGGNAWTNSGMGTSIAGHWGNPGINDGANGGPEYRRYSWIDNTTTSKVAYTAYIMTGATTGGSVVPATTKIYIKIEQVTGL